MDYLFIFHEDESPFELEELRGVLEGIAGVTEVTEADLVGSRLRCEYEFGEDHTTVRLSENLKRITVHGSGDASLQMALELQRRSSRSLRVTDFDYGFDLRLKEISSLQDFDKKIRDAYAVSDRV